MSESKEEREAREEGEREARYIAADPLGYLITGGVADRPSDPKLGEAYDKGLSGKK